LFRVEAVTDEEGFIALKDDWNRLAAEAGLTVFQTWEWAWHWWQANGRGKKLWLLTAYSEGGLAGIAPLYISSSYYGFPVKVAAFIGTNGTDYLDFVLRREDPAPFSVLIDYLLESQNWDAIDLHQLPHDSVASDLVRSGVPGKFVYEFVPQDASYILKLPDSWEELLAGLSKKFRWNVQYYQRRLARDHEVSFRLSDKHSIEKDMALFFRLHQKRFLSKKKPGAYLSPKFRKFHTDLAETLCSRGWLRLYTMEIDGKGVASLYGFQFNDSFYYYLGGFDPDWGSMSVSTVLIARAMEDSIEQGLKRFDFLRGQEPYKKKWLAREYFNQRLIISRPGKRSGMAQKFLSLESDLTRRVKEKIEK